MQSQSHLTNYKPLYTASVPEYIKVDYSLPNQTRQVIQVDPQVFAKERGMTSWSETVLLEPFSQVPISKFVGYPINQTRFNNIIEQTKKTSLVIANMGEQLGFGVYTEKSIAKNDVVSIYTGLATSHFRQSEPEEQSEYLFAIQDSEDKQLASVDAKEYGNVSRFFPHFPNCKKHIELANYSNQDNYIFNNTAAEKNIATANLAFIPYWYNNFFITTVRALRDINAGEWLGVDYGNYWWNTERHPLLIGIDGVPNFEYKISHWLLRINIENKHYLGVELDADDIKNYLSQKLIADFDTGTALCTAEVSPQDFAKAWEKTPATSPYIFVSKPTHLIKHDYKAEKIKQNDLDDQIKNENASFQKLKKGFFLSEADQIQQECHRLFKNYSDANIQYYKKNNTIVIMHNDKEVINEIKANLCNDFIVKSGRNEKTKTPMLYIIEPRLEKLRSVSTLAGVSGQTLTF